MQDRTEQGRNEASRMNITLLAVTQHSAGEGGSGARGEAVPDAAAGVSK